MYNRSFIVFYLSFLFPDVPHLGFLKNIKYLLPLGINSFLLSRDLRPCHYRKNFCSISLKAVASAPRSSVVIPAKSQPGRYRRKPYAERTEHRFYLGLKSKIVLIAMWEATYFAIGKNTQPLLTGWVNLHLLPRSELTSNTAEVKITFRNSHFTHQRPQPKTLKRKKRSQKPRIL